MASLALGVKFNPASSGTGDFVYSSVVTGYVGPAASNPPMVNSKIYRYRAESADLSQWEWGSGPYDSATQTVARTTITLSSTGSKVAFSAPPVVGIVPFPADILQFDDIMSLTAAQQQQGRQNLGVTIAPKGRLTLQSGVAVMPTTQNAKTTLLYTPYGANQIPIYDGSSMAAWVFPELSVSTTDTTKSPAAIGANKVNDWFVWPDAGTLRLGHGPDWTSDTVRSAGTALVNVNGIWLNNAAITNGPAASRGTYVGTTRSNGSSQLDWIIGGAASGGTAGFLGVWNAYNRRPFNAKVTDNGAGYALSVNTIRQARASVGNQVTIVVGLQEDALNSSYAMTFSMGAVNTVSRIGIGYDTITALSSPTQYSYTESSNGPIMSRSVSYATMPAIGVHVLAGLEASTSATMNSLSDAQLDVSIPM